MDLIIETKQYKLNYDHLEMSYIHNFLSNKIGRYIEACEKIKITKKEMKELINWLKTLEFSYVEQKEILIAQLLNMEMLMQGKEKASFYFW